MNSDFGNDTSIDSIPSMTSERSTKISSMIWPYRFNAKLLEKKYSLESPIKDEFERKMKSSRRKQDIRHAVLDPIKIKQEKEFIFELDKSDPFLQPSSFAIKSENNPPKKSIKGLKNSQEQNNIKENYVFFSTDRSESNNNSQSKYISYDLPLIRKEYSTYYSQLSSESNKKQEKKNLSSAKSEENSSECFVNPDVNDFSSPIQVESRATLYSPMKFITHKLGTTYQSEEASNESMTVFDQEKFMLKQASANSLIKKDDKDLISDENLIKLSDSAERYQAFSSEKIEKSSPKTLKINKNFIKDESIVSEIQQKRIFTNLSYDEHDDIYNQEKEKKFQSPLYDIKHSILMTPDLEKGDKELYEFLKFERSTIKSPFTGNKDNKSHSVIKMPLSYSKIKITENEIQLNENENENESIQKHNTKLKNLKIKIEDSENFNLPRKLINELYDVASNIKNEKDTEIREEKITKEDTNRSRNLLKNSMISEELEEAPDVWINQMNTDNSLSISTNRIEHILKDKTLNYSDGVTQRNKLEFSNTNMKSPSNLFTIHDEILIENYDENTNELLSPAGIPYSLSDRKILTQIPGNIISNHNPERNPNFNQLVTNSIFFKENNFEHPDISMDSNQSTKFQAKETSKKNIQIEKKIESISREMKPNFAALDYEIKKSEVSKDLNKLSWNNRLVLQSKKPSSSRANKENQKSNKENNQKSNPATKKAIPVAQFTNQKTRGIQNNSFNSNSQSFTKSFNSENNFSCQKVHHAKKNETKSLINKSQKKGEKGTTLSFSKVKSSFNYPFEEKYTIL